MNKQTFLLAIVLQVGAIASAQNQNSNSDTLLPANELQDVVVSTNRFLEKQSKVAATVKVIRASQFKRLNSSNMGNILESSGNAFVQKSQQGGGSPVLRGFEASRILLNVDGVRMNNAIYRAGHLQNIITIDPNIIDRVEILYGPTSSLYGSDALGGVVNMLTMNPGTATEGKKTVMSAHAAARYSSAIGETMGHADVSIGRKKWASLTSITYSDFGDVITGKKENRNYPAFGLRPFYVERINGRDSAITGRDSFKLTPSSYRQWDVMQKILFKPSANVSHLLNVQVSQSSNIPRFDRLTEVVGTNPRFGEWYYGPQKRLLAAYTFEQSNRSGFFNQMKAIASYQKIEESRYDRRFRQSVRNERIEKINVAGLTIDGRRTKDKSETTIGAELQLNNLISVAQGYNVDNDAITKIPTRYPAGDNNMSYLAAYAQHLYKITDRLTLNEGVRINYVKLNSTFSDTAFYKFPYTKAEQSHVAFSGNAGITYAASDNFKVAIIFSTGFRSPNFDDITKVFDSRSGLLVVPNPDLLPEYTYNAELNMVKYLAIGSNSNAVAIGGSVFRTWLRNAIVVDRFKFMGQDSVVYGGVNSAVVSSLNKAEAYIWGWNVYTRVSLVPQLILDANVTYTYGRYTGHEGEVPLDHIPPVFGRIGVRYENKNISTELYMLFNGWKRIEHYSHSGEDNQQYATADGMPAWQTFNFRAQYGITSTIAVQAGVENIIDSRYRTFSSGISAPGRNIIIGVKAEF